MSLMHRGALIAGKPRSYRRLHRRGFRGFAPMIVTMNNKAAPHLCSRPGSRSRPTGSMGAIRTGDSP
ncbi:conserved hypothetical protein [Pseudomonas chlororaphis]